MRAKLVSRTYGDFTFGQEATIGRSEDNSIRLDSSVISTQHARIGFDSALSRYVVEDLGSLNGTLLDGVPVERPEPLASLHVICFGGSEDFIFHALGTEEDDGEIDTLEIPPTGKTQVGEDMPVLPEALREGAKAKKTRGMKSRGKKVKDGGTRIEKDVVPIPEVLAAASAGATDAKRAAASESGSDASRGPITGPTTGWCLAVQLEDGPTRFPLAEGENLVGRSGAAAIRLDIADLSRRHAVITVKEGKVFVRDEGSRNHTFVEDREIETETPVADGSRVVFGRVEARLVADGDDG